MMARRTPAPLPTSDPDHRYALPADFDARNTLRLQRRRLKTAETRTAREAAARARLELDEAANAPDGSAARVRYAVADATAALVRAVAASFGQQVTVDVAFHLGDTMVRTEVDNIVVRLPISDLPDLEREFDPEPLRRLVSMVKGFGYHELGHLRFTTPFHHLVNTAIPRDRRRHLATPLPGEAVMRESWQLLEDQRMEAALVAESPMMAHYMTAIVLRHVTDRVDAIRRLDAMWLGCAGRTYLPADVRADLRSEFFDRFGPAVTDELEQLTRSYMQATDAMTMVQAVLKLHDLKKRLSGPDDGARTSDHQPEPHDDREPRPETVERIERSAAPADPEPPASDDKHQDGGDDHDGHDPNGILGDDIDELDDLDSPSPSLQGVHHAALAAAQAQCLDDHSIDDTVRSIYEQAGLRRSVLPPANVLRRQDPELAEEAERTAHAIAVALRPFTESCAPSWLARQPRGVIDPFAYRTRAPGSRDFHRSFTGLDDAALGIAVSLLLDVSGSMSGTEQLLAASAFACKRACEYIDIPCTVSVFSSQSRLLWSADDRADHVVPVPDGSTDPTGAARALDEQRFDRPHHLVVVLTDGAILPVFPGFGAFSDPGRYFLGLALGTPVAWLRNSQVHEALAITSVTELPTILTSFLTAYLR